MPKKWPSRIDVSAVIARLPARISVTRFGGTLRPLGEPVRVEPEWLDHLLLKYQPRMAQRNSLVAGRKHVAQVNAPGLVIFPLDRHELRS
jgi:hypothetical protein